MPNFTTEQIREAMNHPDKIRNFTIVAQVDAGKSCLSDSLLYDCGMISKKDAGDKRQTDTMKQEQERGITIKSVGVSMCFPHEKGDHVLNVIDSPGHVDFNSEVSAALRVTDGAMVLIDTIDGVKAQTKTVMIQALENRIKPVLVINKIDKLFLSLELKPEEIYDQFVRNTIDVNSLIETYQDPVIVKFLGEQHVNPMTGNVVFASAYHTWGFSLNTFAKIYAPKMNKDVATVMKLLWKKENFIKMILNPIYYVLNACQSYPEVSKDGEMLPNLLETLDIKLLTADFDLRGKELIRRVMHTWLPVAKAIRELAINHLPSPRVAQEYRVDLLYKGPKDDKYYNAIKTCDPLGPLIMYVSKMVPTKDNSHFYAFGRVFSGIASTGKIKILYDEHDPLKLSETQSKHKTFTGDTVQRVVMMMANLVESVPSIPVGNTLALDGICKSLVKFGTVVGDDCEDCYPIKSISFSVSPVVQCAIKPKKASDIAKFSEQIKKFIKSDPCMVHRFTDEGEHILAGAGELHLEVALEQLKTDFLKGMEFTVSDPIVPYRETIEEPSDRICLVKSANKHNRLFVSAEPLNQELVKEMIAGDLPIDIKARNRYLATNYEFGDYAKKIWYLGPEVEPSNMFVDETKGVQFLHEIKDSVKSGFMHSLQKGPLAEEPVCGARFNLQDVTMHADAIHRGAGQLIPATRSVVCACIMASKPRLLEPIFRVHIQVPQEKVSTIHNVMCKRRGLVDTILPSGTGDIVDVEAEMPVAESFGFMADLRCATSGEAFATMCFDRWEKVPGDPLEEGSYANTIVKQIRKRKGLKDDLPKLEDYNHKL